MDIIREKTKILLADDELENARPIIDYLKSRGFTVIHAADGQETLALTYREMPNIILLDINMPKKSGYQVLSEIKKDIIISHIPIIMLTSQSSVDEKVKGLYQEIDDYITKPFDNKEVLARITMVLKRSYSYKETNPLTGLPGNASLESYLNNLIKSKAVFAVLYIDLNDFKPYNDYYGFVKGDMVIKLTAQVIVNAATQAKTGNNFVSHIGGDDFIVVTQAESAEGLCTSIINNFQSMVTGFYDKKDLKTGYISVKNRAGIEQKFRMLSIAIGVVSNEAKPFSSPGEIAQTGAEMKCYAKTFKKTGSKFVIDKRKE